MNKEDWQGVEDDLEFFFEDDPVEPVQDVTWLDLHYGGAPDECTPCFISFGIVKLDAKGNCPRCGDRSDEK